MAVCMNLSNSYLSDLFSGRLKSFICAFLTLRCNCCFSYHFFFIFLRLPSLSFLRHFSDIFTFCPLLSCHAITLELPCLPFLAALLQHPDLVLPFNVHFLMLQTSVRQPSLFLPFFLCYSLAAAVWLALLCFKVRRLSDRPFETSAHIIILTLVDQC